jgi:hypothetical protein
MATVIWAFKPLPELNHQTGMVECDEALAQQLIADGRAQDLSVGAFALKHVEDAPPPRDPHEYKTTALKPPRKRS